MTSTVHRDEPPEDGARASAQARVRLRALEHADQPAIRRWMADPDVIRFTVLVPSSEYSPVRPYAPAAADRYLKTLIAERTRRSFAILVDDRHVGNVGLKELDLGKGHGECFIEIGEPDVRGHGVGTRAMELLLEHAFLQLGMNEVTLGVFEFNHPARALYRRLGFAYVGTYGWHWADGQFWHVQQLTITRAEWQARRAPSEGA